MCFDVWIYAFEASDARSKVKKREWLSKVAPTEVKLNPIEPNVN
jgi:hypothetical protein